MKRAFIALVLVLAMLLGAAPVVAQTPTPLTLDQAVQQVRRTTNGRVLSAQTVNRQGRRVHRIKVLTDDGRVRTIEMNAPHAVGPGDGNRINPALRPGLTDQPPPVEDRRPENERDNRRKRERGKKKDD